MPESLPDILHTIETVGVSEERLFLERLRLLMPDEAVIEVSNIQGETIMGVSLGNQKVSFSRTGALSSHCWPDYLEAGQLAALLLEKLEVGSVNQVSQVTAVVRQAAQEMGLEGSLQAKPATNNQCVLVYHNSPNIIVTRIAVTEAACNAKDVKYAILSVLLKQSPENLNRLISFDLFKFLLKTVSESQFPELDIAMRRNSIQVSKPGFAKKLVVASRPVDRSCGAAQEVFGQSSNITRLYYRDLFSIDGIKVAFEDYLDCQALTPVTTSPTPLLSGVRPGSNFPPS